MVTGAATQISSGGLQGVSGSLTTMVVGAISATGYLGVFGLMLVESVSLPIPSEVILPFAGYLVSIGRLEFWFTVILATAAGVLGAFVDYYIGLFLGMRVVSDYGSRFFIDPKQMKRVERLFQKHGGAIVFASRLVPGLRTLISFPAGSARMNLLKFAFYTALGCFLFDTALVYAGDYLGAHWSAIRAVGTLELVATVVVILIAIWMVVHIRRDRSSDNPGTGVVPATSA